MPSVPACLLACSPLTLLSPQVHLPLEGFYSFLFVFPAFLLLSVAFANFTSRLNTLQRLVPLLYGRAIPAVPVAEPLASAWALRSIKQQLKLTTVAIVPAPSAVPGPRPVDSTRPARGGSIFRPKEGSCDHADVRSRAAAAGRFGFGD